MCNPELLGPLRKVMEWPRHLWCRPATRPRSGVARHGGTRARDNFAPRRGGDTAAGPIDPPSISLRRGASLGLWADGRPWKEVVHLSSTKVMAAKQVWESAKKAELSDAIVATLAKEVEAAEAALDANSNVCFWLRGMVPSTLASIPEAPDAVELHDVAYPPVEAFDNSAR